MERLELLYLLKRQVDRMIAKYMGNQMEERLVLMKQFRLKDGIHE